MALLGSMAEQLKFRFARAGAATIAGGSIQPGGDVVILEVTTDPESARVAVLGPGMEAEASPGQSDPPVVTVRAATELADAAQL